MNSFGTTLLLVFQIRNRSWRSHPGNEVVTLSTFHILSTYLSPYTEGIFVYGYGTCWLWISRSNSIQSVWWRGKRCWHASLVYLFIMLLELIMKLSLIHEQLCPFFFFFIYLFFFIFFTNSLYMPTISLVFCTTNLFLAPESLISDHFVYRWFFFCTQVILSFEVRIHEWQKGEEEEC